MSGPEPPHDRVALAQLEAWRKLVQTSGAGAAACTIFRILRVWIARSLEPGWVEPLPITDLDGGKSLLDESADHSLTWIRWTWALRDYVIELAWPDGGGRHGVLVLAIDDVAVMLLDVELRSGTAESDLVMRDVGHLDPGPWMVQVRELADQLRETATEG